MRCGEFKGAAALARFQHFNLLIQALEYLAQALAHECMVIDHKNFQHLE